jgi:hypothetical protein
LVNSTTLQKIAIEVPPISAADSAVTGVSRVAVKQVVDPFGPRGWTWQSACA